jgi:hypothetical protein
MNTVLAFLFGISLLAFIIWRQRRGHRDLAVQRRSYFDSCLPLFDSYTISQTGIEYPRLVGKIEGREVQVTPIIDTLSVRKLPSLWLLVTVPHLMPVTATFDLLMRPLGTESFTNHHLLPVTLPTPAGWPVSAIIRTDNPAGIPPEHVLEPFVAKFDRREAKELLITPKGVRIVVQAAQAMRGYYLVYRLVNFETSALDKDLLEEIIRDLFQLIAAITAWNDRFDGSNEHFTST